MNEDQRRRLEDYRKRPDSLNDNERADFENLQALERGAQPQVEDEPVETPVDAPVEEEAVDETGTEGTLGEAETVAPEEPQAEVEEANAEGEQAESDAAAAEAEADSEQAEVSDEDRSEQQR